MLLGGVKLKILIILTIMFVWTTGNNESKTGVVRSSAASRAVVEIDQRNKLPLASHLPSLLPLYEIPCLLVIVYVARADGSEFQKFIMGMRF